MFKRSNNNNYTLLLLYNIIPGGHSLTNNLFIKQIKKDEDSLIVDDVVKISKNGSLTVKSNVYKILSLSSIFLLIPGSHSKTMIT
ncbi:2796_t:CDS:2, partial [Diversispora eburnea]